MSQPKVDFSKPPEGTQRIDMSVTYCTSESDVHRANNVLLPDRYRIWQTKEKEPQAVIELQFSSPIKIKALDICNAGSAFIEVQAGELQWESQEFNVLVPITNFMSSNQSKNKTNRNEMKRFEGKQLHNVNRSWEKIRIICTQQFEISEIGLSCLSVYVADNNSISSSSNGVLTTSNIEDSSLKRSKSSLRQRNSGLTSSKSISEPQPPTPPSDFNVENSNIRNNQDIEMNDINPIPLSNPLPGDVIVVQNTSNDNDTDVEDNNINNNNKANNNNNVNINTSNEKGLKKNKPAKDSDDTESDNENVGYLTTEAKELPLFSKLLNGVVMVIGGIINPEKGELRDKALEMGAEYRPGWCREATLLITPFEGTPKYLEAKKSGGSVVRPSWIYDCYKQKSRLPIKQYQFEEMPKTPKTPEKKSSDSSGKDKDKKKKKSQVVSTTKKFKKKANPDTDDSDDDSHIPNQFDYSDGFLVKDSDASDVEDNKDSDDDNYDPNQDYGGVKSEESEDLNSLFKDGQDFLKRTFGFDYKSKHDKNHPKKKLKLDESNNNNKNKNKHKEESQEEEEEEEVFEIKNKNYGVNRETSKISTLPDKNNSSQSSQKESIVSTTSSSPSTTTSSNNKKPGGITLVPKTSTPPPSQSSQFKDSEDHTQRMSPDQISNEINRLIETEKLRNSGSIIDEEMKDLIQDKDTEKEKEKEIKKPLYKPTRSFLIGKEYIIDPLPTFFDGVEFYISIKDEISRNEISRFIIAYKGTITTTPKPTSRFVITDKTAWDKLFDITLSKFPNILFVPPSFIKESHSLQTLPPVEQFLIEKKKIN